MKSKVHCFIQIQQYLFIEQIEMLGFDQSDASVAVRVRGINVGPQVHTTPQTTFNVVGESNGKTIYGTTHIGTHDGWNDNFVVNMSSLEYDDLELITFINDQQFGRGRINFMEMVRSNSNAGSDDRIQLLKGGSTVGYLLVDFMRSKREDVVGGLQPPFVSLKHGAVHVEQQHAAGIQKVRAKKLNFFSCMDANDMGWEFMPFNFQTKLRETYSDRR